MTQEQDLARLTRAVERIADSLERQERTHTIYVDDRSGYAYSNSGPKEVKNDDSTTNRKTN